jgi:hypothetical protein
MSQGPGRPAGAERRASVRYYPNGADTLTHIMALVEGQSSRVGVRNLSAGGISLILDDWIEPGTLVSVRLHNPGRLFSCKLPVRVIYLVERPAGDWILGGAFARKLLLDELRALLC